MKDYSDLIARLRFQTRYTHGQVPVTMTEAADALEELTAAVPAGWKLVPVEILDRFQELNPSNYDHDDVCELNAWAVELVLAAAPEAPSQPVEQRVRLVGACQNCGHEHDMGLAQPTADAKDAKRLDFITAAESAWSVQWQKRPGKPVRYRMIDDGEPWGRWLPTARAAIDAAMAKGGS